MDASATIFAQIGTAQDPRESEPSISRGGEGLKQRSIVDTTRCLGGPNRHCIDRSAFVLSHPLKPLPFVRRLTRIQGPRVARGIEATSCPARALERQPPGVRCDKLVNGVRPP